MTEKIIQIRSVAKYNIKHLLGLIKKVTIETQSLYLELCINTALVYCIAPLYYTNGHQLRYFLRTFSLTNYAVPVPQTENSQRTCNSLITWTQQGLAARLEGWHHCHVH